MTIRKQSVIELWGDWDLFRFSAYLGIGCDDLLSRWKGRMFAPPVRSWYPVHEFDQDQPILLVPTYAQPGWKNFETLIEEFRLDHPVLTGELVGVTTGLSKRPPPVSYTFRNEIQVLESVAAEASSGKGLHIISWSHGAQFGIEFALRNPRQVRSLVVIEPFIPAALANGELVPEEREWLRKLYPENIEDHRVALELYVHLGILPADTDLAKVQTYDWWFEHGAYGDYFGSRIRAATEYKVDFEALRQLQVPVLLVMGRDTTPLFKKIGARYAELLPKCRVLELPGKHAPHSGPGFQEFVREVRKFINEHSGSPVTVSGAPASLKKVG